MKAIINGKIITEEKVLENKILVFNERILEFKKQKNSEHLFGNFEEIIDAKGNYVSPGFIDIHTHGSGGHDVMDGTQESLSSISSVITRNGVTGFLPTTMTMSKERIYNALDNIRYCMGKEIKGAKILGAHMEGPFINKKYKGAHAEDFIIEPDFSFIEKYVDIIKIITLAPEMAVHCPDATANINAGGIMPVKKLLKMGINLAIGSDIGSGASLSIARGIVSTIEHSKIRNMFDPQWEAVNLAEAFYMATRSGGRYFKNVGAFEEEYCFNALIIDDSNMYSEDITPVERLERFCYVGDDRNICMRYIMGKEVEI